MNKALIDYDSIWQVQTKVFDHSGNTAGYWNCRSRTYDSEWKTSSYASELLKRIDLQPEYSVLDVACGTGVTTIPIARKVRHVTALDISPMMLGKLRSRLKSAYLNNVTIVNKDWNNVDIGKDMDEHDIVLVSRSLPGLSLSETLQKFNQAATRACYIVWRAECIDERDNEINDALGKKHQPYPHFSLIYGMLANLGISANVEIFTASSRERYPSLNEAVLSMAKGQEITKKQYAKLMNIAKNYLTLSNGYYCSDYAMKWALISWHKSDSLSKEILSKYVQVL